MSDSEEVEEVDHALTAEEADIFLALYGTGQNGDISIQVSHNNALIVCYGEHVFDVAAANEHAVHFFTHNDAYMLSFPKFATLQERAVIFLEQQLNTEWDDGRMVVASSYTPLRVLAVKQKKPTLVE
jgi:hypothetical protein